MEHSATFLKHCGHFSLPRCWDIPIRNWASSYSFSLGVQREVGHAIVVDVAVVGSLGRNLEMAQNLNQLPYGARGSSQQPGPDSARQTPSRRFPSAIPRLRKSSLSGSLSGSSSYYALQTQANRRFSNGLEFKANWTWSKSMDFGSTDGTTLPTYARRNVLSYGRSTFDRTFITKLSWLYEIPGLRRMTNPVLGTVLGHWNLSGIPDLCERRSHRVSASHTVSGVDLIGGGDGQRINISGNPQLGYGTRNGDRSSTPACSRNPHWDISEALRRDVYRGPGQNQWDLSAFKNFVIREKVSFQFRGEFYNAFNHAQWSTINSGATFNAAGQQINTLFGKATADRALACIQLP